ncbi:MAG: phosphatase PAP2 family protein [Chloroflexia bacterium]
MAQIGRQQGWRTAARARLERLQSRGGLFSNLGPPAFEEEEDFTTEELETLGTVERALAQVRSEEEADRLLDELERRSGGRTQADVEDDSAVASAAPVEEIRRSVSQAPPEDRPVEALETVVEETTAEQSPETDRLAAILQEAMVRPQGKTDGPHKLLRRAVLKRMTPVQAVDASVYIAITRLPHLKPITRFMSGVSTVSMHGAGWTVAAVALALVDRRRGRRAAIEMIPALLVTNTLVERVVKRYIRRRRPFITMVKAMVVGRKPGSWSFPSGHSACSFACASALSGRYRSRRKTFYGLAALVGFSRVYLGHHYPTDVISGATLGEALSRVVVWTSRRFWPRLGS